MRGKKVFLAQSLILDSFEIQQGLIEVKNKLQEIFRLIFIVMIPPVLFGILYLYRSTWRLTVLDENLKPSGRNRLKNFLYAHWHEDIPVLSLKGGVANVCTMASQSRDGEVIARVLKWFGYEVCRGSSRRGGGAALLQMKRAYQSGKNLALAVDGPRGPRHEVKAGIVALAEKGGSMPIVIGTANAKYKFVFRKSWDQMWFPLPFSPVVVIYSDPIRFETNPSFEERRLHIKSRLCDLKEKTITYYSTK